ncbi:MULTISPECIES: hypothetical protein [Leptolyngbya]|uniref:Uncharacterized protein n=2 Tax=Leptolyngbya boryana TaxID=1184 RepID=A0A1Z4JML7_LEPBY|nr:MULTISPECIES: hypothetical protein [Leptolyngbya]BAY57991.1 hypothetical protein NIES2135_48640 [Leptolyngbya boryana NIES-2135]MBD1856246.1 hypothetical protein [Leptolyngbya sp. FACHB-1624]MBD2367435.1 hypothetical protein [Leptolyngbya sp. FACHB-161]MBD2373959.1 hypothetical protein [Leptolyngbya sp. FACHB-238]MBD2398241.1 hypothetical protein [Leptolyngbya sp. FACHB-239]
MKTKRLELFLLAGCSCLITLLTQPIASAIASPPTLPHLQAPRPVAGAFCGIKEKKLQAQTTLN